MKSNQDADRWGTLADDTRLALVARLAEGHARSDSWRHLDRHGPGWEAVSDGVDGTEGWPLALDRYAAVVKEGS